MPITITSDRIILKDNLGVTKFDTNEGLFVCTNFKAGSIELEAVSANATSFNRSNVDTTNNHLVATGVSTSATHILGLYRSNWSVSANWEAGVSAQQVGGGRWRSCNATAIDMIVKHSSSHQAGAPTASQPNYWQGFTLYTFYLSGGNIYCKERIMLQSWVASSGSTNYTLTKNAGTLDFRLYVGLFK